MDEVDEYLGWVRHLAAGVAADCSDLASRAAGTVAAQVTRLQIRFQDLN
ncbi:MAG: hypothetical protein ABI859_07170 [Pseudomonadota bacterium]